MRREVSGGDQISPTPFEDHQNQPTWNQAGDHGIDPSKQPETTAGHGNHTPGEEQ